MSFTDLHVKELQGSILPSSFSEAKNTVLTLVSENEGITDAVVGMQAAVKACLQSATLLSSAWLCGKQGTLGSLQVWC